MRSSLFSFPSLWLTNNPHPHTARSLGANASSSSPSTWLSTILQQRVEPALPLVGLAPDMDLVLLSLHLAVRAMVLRPGQQQPQQQPDHGAEVAFAVGLRVVLALLALPCEDNRLAAHRELACFLQHGCAPLASQPTISLLSALAASLPQADAAGSEAIKAALISPLAPRTLARALLRRDKGAALLRQLLVFGVRDPVPAVRAAVWDALGGVMGASDGGKEEKEEGVRSAEEEEEALLVKHLPRLMPLLVAARGQADAEEGRGAAATATRAEAATAPLGTPGPRGLLARFLLQMAQAATQAAEAAVGPDEDWTLLALLLDLFSPTRTIRLGARRQLHTQLQQRCGAASWPKACTVRPDAVFAQDEEAYEVTGRTGDVSWGAQRSAAAVWAGAPQRYGEGVASTTAAAAAEEAAASPARLGALCDLLLDPGALGEAELLMAARDLTLLLTMSMGRAGAAGEEGPAAGTTSAPLPPWAVARVLGAARQLLDSGVPTLELAGAELFLAIAWTGSPVSAGAVRTIAPFLFHPSPAIRGTLRLALLPALFGRRDYWAAAVPEEEGVVLRFSDRAPHEVVARVPSSSTEEEEASSIAYLLHGPPAPGGTAAASAAALVLQAFLADCFCLPSSGSSPAGRLPRPLVWMHPLPLVDPARDALSGVIAGSGPTLSALLDALIPLWYRQSLPDAAAAAGPTSRSNPLLSPVPAVALTPHGPSARAGALAQALHDAGSHSALSAALQALTQAVLAVPEVADAFLALEWTKALGRLLQVRALALFIETVCNYGVGSGPCSPLTL